MRLPIDNLGFIWQENSSGKNAGDSVWRSGWIYGSFAILGKLDNNLFQSFAEKYKIDPMLCCETFLKSFADQCIEKDRLIVHPSYHQHFSRDQLSGLIFLFATIVKYQKHLTILAKPILQKILEIDDKYGKLCDHENGIIRDNLRYPLSVLATAYGLPYKNEKGPFSYCATLKLYETMWSNLKWAISDDKLPRPYTIFNNAGILTSLAIILGKQKDIKKYAKNFEYFAKDGWGVIYKIITGIKYTQKEIDIYKGLKQSQNDIASQRGKDHFRVNGYIETYDYLLLQALSRVWG